MRARIQEAAQDLFLKRGFDNVSMRAIASRIGYSPGAIYRYFKNKKEILSVIRHDAFAAYLKQMQQVDAAVPPLERVRLQMKMAVRQALSDPEVFELMFNMGPSTVALGGEWAELPHKVYDHFFADVAACVAEGYFQGQDVETVVVGLWSAVHGYCTLAVKSRLDALVSDDDAAKRGENIVDFLLSRA